MNEGVIKVIGKAIQLAKKADNPTLKLKTPKPIAKFKSFVKKTNKLV